ncbi:MAG: XdhC family protein [Jatrophihabitantaceae bacterium]
MYEIADQVAGWLAQGRSVHVAQVVATSGFSSREPGAALAWTDDGQAAGALFPGMQLDHPDARGLAEVAITDAQAVEAGLSCGGLATVLTQDAAAYPPQTWERLRRREPLCLVTQVASLVTSVYSRANVRDAAAPAPEAPRLFARGTSATAVFDGPVAVVTLWPPRHLLVIGGGTIAAALADNAALLGWTSTVSEEVSVAIEQARGLTDSDAVVVLSHDRTVDVPALASALAGRAGYVGALGSRGTQAARREGLAALGIGTAALARIHGPAGLDIDAHTPAEIAVSIAAEILATRSGSSGGAISDRGGPVHAGGVTRGPVHR